MHGEFTRSLGRSGIQVSPLGMGCWAIGGPFWRDGIPVGWGKVDDAEFIRAIHRALDLGVNFFDTSDVYGTGHSEEILGKALAGSGKSAVVATKFGNVFDTGTRSIIGADASPGFIRRACEDSLRRLKMERIDLYQFHLGGYDPDKAGEVRNTLEELVSEGKIRSYGWSTDSTISARVFAEGEHCAAIQHHINVLEDAAEMLSLCEELNLASINRGPLAMGMLTGKFTPDSKLGDDDVRGDRGPGWMQAFRDGKPNPVWLAKVASIRQVTHQ